MDGIFFMFLVFTVSVDLDFDEAGTPGIGRNEQRGCGSYWEFGSSAQQKKTGTTRDRGRFSCAA
jgi:hypothetical protein